MNINTTNPRRSIWFSQQPPVNKADVWLSYNRHYSGQEDDPETENDESIEIDSQSQRKCDLVMKIWDCGEWKPILGYNSTAANKIDCVENNTLYHPAIFTGQNPNDISDNGSLGELLADSHYVNEQEWEDIFNTDQFQQAFNTQVIDGDDYNWESLIETTVQELLDDGEITIPAGQVNWRRATTSLLGGIKAASFRSIIPQNEVAEACFNDNIVDQTQNNDRLYIWAKDMMQAIQEYTNEHSDDPDFPEIVPPYVIPEEDVPDLLWDWFENSSTVLKGWQQSTGQAVADKPRFVIAGSRTAANRGKLLKLRDPDDPFWLTSEYTELNNAIEWVDPSELFSDYQYDLNVATTTELGGIKAATHTRNLMPESQVAECKFYNPQLLPTNSYKRQALCIDIKDVKSALDAWYASNDSTPLDLDVYASDGVDVSKSIWHDDHTGTDRLVYWYGLNNYPDKAGLFPRSANLANPTVYGDTNGLEWVSLSLDMMRDISFSNNIANGDVLIYNNGQWTNGQSAGTGGTVYSVFDVNSNGLVPGPSTASNKLFLNASGTWTAPPDTNTTYTVFTGATASTNGSTGLVLAPASGQQTSVLVGDKSWKPVSDVFNINTNNNVITANGDFTLNNNILSADYAGAHTDLGTLYPWNYYIISCNKSNTQFNFSISSARSDAGNPIYIRINTDAQMTLGGQIDYINSNNVFVGNTTLDEGSSYLLTIQFEIVKIEKIAITKQSGGGSAEEPAG